MNGRDCDYGTRILVVFIALVVIVCCFLYSQRVEVRYYPPEGQSDFEVFSADNDGGGTQITVDTDQGRLVMKIGELTWGRDVLEGEREYISGVEIQIIQTRGWKIHQHDK